MVGSVPENLSREHYVYLAKLAEQSKRYDDMVSFMHKVVVEFTPASELSLEERKLLSIAYKNVIGSLRAAWRIVSLIDEKEEGRKNKDHVVFRKEYKSKVEAELTNVCASVLKLLESSLIPFASSSESKVFYYTMKGDYQRYLAEFKICDERKSAVEDAMLSYKIAQDIAVGNLPASHPVRLGLALNLSVFYYEILNQRDKACDMAIQAFGEANHAAGELVKLGEEYYKESKLTMQLLRDNIFLWTPYLQEKDLHPLDFC